MVIALSQLNYRIGDFEGNTEKICASIREAKAKGADLIVFAELAIGGYPAKDLLRSAPFLAGCAQSIEQIAAQCVGIACIIGAPVPNTTGSGKKLFNAGLVLAEGKVKQAAHKGLLPDYDVFDEYRYFEPARSFACVEVNGKRLALTICEDLWDASGAKLYAEDPLGQLLQDQPDLIINIAASPFDAQHFERRVEVLRAQVERSGLPLMYLNHVGAHTDIIFDGRSLVFGPDGQLLDVMAGFAEDLRLYELAEGRLSPLQPATPAYERSEIGLIHQALILGIRDYFQKSGFSKAVLGLSGGLDSAIVAALAVEALGAGNVLAVLMPSVYSSDHSIEDALELVQLTGCQHQIIPIKDVATAFDQTLVATFAGRHPDLTEENIQARIRGTLLMAISNKLGYVLLNTSNKSEAAVGYGTLYGDMAGALSVIGDVYKSQAYELARYINRDRLVIPINTIEKPPSAELRPDQKDSDSLPEYELLDAVLYQHIELEKGREQLVGIGFEPNLVDRVLALVARAEFKRFQAPPTLRVSAKSFGPGRVMPIVGKYP